MSTLAISLGTDVLGFGISALTQHSARVADAKNENAAAQQAINAQTQDIVQVGQALKSGTITIAEAITFCEQEDATIEGYLKGQVGKPGTAWDGTGNCSKTCTIGCCMYYGYIHGGFQNTINSLTKLQQTGQSVTWNYAAISGDKYGLIGRNAFSVTFQSPSVSPTSALTNSVASFASAIGLRSSSGSALSSSSILIIVALVALFFFLARK